MDRVNRRRSCYLDVVATVVLFELELGHAVEELGEMPHDDLGLVSVGEDIEEISRRHEVESREGESLRLEIFSKCLLAQRQLTLDRLQTFKKFRSVRRRHHVLALLDLSNKLLEISTNIIL